LQTIAGVPTWSASVGAPGYATTLPGSPTNGQEAILVDSTTAPTYHWRFRYNSSSASTYKWEFIGGTPAYAIVTTAETTTSTTYTNLTTTGPSFTIPNAGDWHIEAHTLISTKSGDGHAFMAYDVGGTAASDDWACGGFGWNANAMGISRALRWTALSASTAVVGKYKMLSGTNATFKNRVLRITPVRVI
jgi:hypothetical protein